MFIKIFVLLPESQLEFDVYRVKDFQGNFHEYLFFFLQKARFLRKLVKLSIIF